MSNVCFLIFNRVFSCGSHTAARSTDCDVGVGWGGSMASESMSLLGKFTLPQPVIILFFDVGVFLMGFGGRRHECDDPQPFSVAPQQQQQLQVGRKRARPGEDARQACRSEIRLEHLSAGQRVCILGFSVYSIKYICCSSTEVLNEVMQPRRRKKAILGRFNHSAWS